MKPEKCEDSDMQKEVFESTILYNARLDAWIATELKCIGCEEVHGGQRQKK